MLEAKRSAEQLAESSEYAALAARAEELERTLQGEMGDFDAVVEPYRAIERGGD